MLTMPHDATARRLTTEARIAPTGSGEADVLRDVAEEREFPPPPEPLRAGWLRTVAWCLPALLAIGLGAAWDGGGADSRSTTMAPELRAWWVALAGEQGLLARVPVILAVGLASALVATLGIRLSGRRAGFVAGMLFALLPSTSAAAFEPGLEAIIVALSVCSTLLVVQLADRQTPLLALGYATCLLVLGVLAPLALVVVTAHAVILAVQEPPRRKRLLVWACAVGSVVTALVAFRARIGLVGEPALRGSALAGVADRWATSFGGAMVAGAVLGMAFIGLTMRGRARAATLYAVVPTACLLALSLTVHASAVWWLVLTAPAWCLVASLSVRRLRLVRGVCAVVLIALLGLPAQVELRQGRAMVTSADEMAASVSRLLPDPAEAGGRRDAG